MTKSDELKKELIQQIQLLSEENLAHLLSYAKFLEYQPEKTVADENSAKTFLNEYIGGISDGRLAKNIDEELYG